MYAFALLLGGGVRQQTHYFLRAAWFPYLSALEISMDRNLFDGRAFCQAWISLIVSWKRHVSGPYARMPHERFFFLKQQNHQTWVKAPQSKLHCPSLQNARDQHITEHYMLYITSIVLDIVQRVDENKPMHMPRRAIFTFFCYCITWLMLCLALNLMAVEENKHQNGLWVKIAFWPRSLLHRVILPVCELARHEVDKTVSWLIAWLEVCKSKGAVVHYRANACLQSFPS